MFWASSRCMVSSSFACRNGVAHLRLVRRFPNSYHPAARAALTPAIAQLTPQNFSDRALGQRVAELDDARNLVAGEIGTAVFQHLLARERRIAPHDEQFDCLAARLVGNTDGRGLEHTGVHGHDFFELVGIDVEAGYQDHVLDAIHDPEIPLRRDQADVAGGEEAVGVDRARRLFRSPPIARHHLGSAYEYLARLPLRQHIAGLVANLHIGARYREAGRARMGLDIWRVDRDRAGSFG